ncbi:MAG: DNA mismatch repair endonuclease MutL [Oscillospiraceae bacterium]|jgi:DNA mismatch repair protein MutL|nr:DNA mismatch repair endonuclease MutL [Oscillospiraceae bacterium]
MPRIVQLPEHVASCIAAGEVVERPASVVKELCENALDAGASKITVSIRGGGIQMLQVSDDGCGLAREDIKTAFLPHATSKIRTAEDLESIQTLGFRGEALPSIAAVARVRMVSCEEGGESGVFYDIHGGQDVGFGEIGAPRGTQITVRDLFYNTPARLKFLKKDVSEGNAVAVQMERLALSRPDVAFSFVRDGKQVFQTPGNGSHGAALRAALGKEIYEQMIACQSAHDGVIVNGFVCLPSYVKSNRNTQYFFLNGRYIKCQCASAALGEAYKHSIPAGKFPACLLYINLEPRLADVNVHPAKTEVRFADERPVFRAVFHAAKAALMGLPQATSARPTQSISGISNEAIAQNIHGFSGELPAQSRTVAMEAADTLNDPAALFADVLPPVRDVVPLIKRAAPQTVPVIEPEQLRETRYAAAQDDLRVLGEVFQTYYLAQCGDRLLLIDKHAAHERVIYERLKREHQDSASVQMFLSPVPVACSRAEAAALLEHLDWLEQAGFLLESFGEDALIARGCPLVLAGEDIDALLSEIAGYFLESRQSTVTKALDWIFHSAACRAAVKAGDPNTSREREHFVRQLLAAPNIRHCPHGRPVMIEIHQKELEKRFGRQ